MKLLALAFGLLLFGCTKHVTAPAPQYATKTTRYAYWTETHAGKDILYVYCLAERDCTEAIKASGWRGVYTRQDLKFVIIFPEESK